ncbi:hypothetical protein FOMPIDRAFT_95621 [Fomitopsis schrenkii]|uniref:Uncharacterized protein n=1 Tax=Fomitopsis schrenkii TaxID=2126942 RepID=S8DWT9_FOMSC|nr:hypothetical protein FOMPIDRAFT_95621 [Fomitopsis schrenkii]
MPVPFIIFALAALFVLPVLSPVLYVAIGGQQFLLTLEPRGIHRYMLDSFFRRELPPANPGGGVGLDAVSPVLYLASVTSFAALIFVTLRLARQYYPRISRDTPATSRDNASARHEHRRTGASTFLRTSTIMHLFGGTPSVQFASEAQPLFTPPSREDSTRRAAESLAGEGPSTIVGQRIRAAGDHARLLPHRSRRVRFVSDSGILVTVDNDSSSLAQHDDHSTAVRQLTPDSDNAESDVPDSPDGGATASESPAHMPAHTLPLAHRDSGAPIASTEADSAHSDAVSMTSDDTDSYESQFNVYPEAGAVPLYDDNLDNTAHEVDDSDVVSDTHSFVEDSDIDSPCTTDGGSVSGIMPLNDCDLDMAANEVDDLRSDTHSITEVDDVLSDTQSVSGASDDGSWVTTDADSGADYSSPDVESDADTWVTTDDSGLEDSDLGSPNITNDGLVSAGSDAHSSVTGSPNVIRNPVYGSPLYSAVSSPCDAGPLAALDSPALSELADDICARLGYVPPPAGPGSGMDATPRRMPPVATSSSVLSVSDRDWSPAPPGFVFSVGAAVPSTSAPAPSASSPTPSCQSSGSASSPSGHGPSSPSRVEHA